MRLIRTLYVSLFAARRRPNKPPPRHARTRLPAAPPAHPVPAPRPAPRQTKRPRPYAAAPVAVPYPDRFGELGARHRHRWRLAYAPDQAAPYQARHCAKADLVLAASDLDALDLALTEFTPPSHVRPYVVRSHGSPAATGRRRMAAGVV
ncbi:MAG: hypothetical protein M0026_22155 [Nocardiopsaceae bacterium]|nr:hypothetical protein [Nocardiopsaceae bacterium]